jgi:hypothetical protein
MPCMFDSSRYAILAMCLEESYATPEALTFPAAALVPRDCDYPSCWRGMQARVFDGQSFSRRGGVEFLIGGNQHHAETGVKPLLVYFDGGRQLHCVVLDVAFDECTRIDEILGQFNAVRG